MVRRTNRPTTAWLSAFLIILQMVMGPVAHPISPGTGSGDCGHGTPHASPQDHGDDPDCRGTHDHAPSAARHDGARDGAEHARCPCPCSHTPALAMPTIVAPQPAPPEGVDGVLKGPAFSPPLFELLRPPN
jgi:hypothetical protein